MQRRIILDTDPGIDDALAILLALASPEIRLEGIVTVHGNCSVEQATVNALSILELAAARDIPVARGFGLPLVQPSLLAAETHGDAGLGYASLPESRRRPGPSHGSDFLIDTIMSSPGEITLLAVGPLTNIAYAIRREPRIVGAVRELITMGGAIRHAGNATPLAEYNVFVDPHAAHIVYHSGMPITLVPLDVTYQCILTMQDVDRLRGTPSAISEFIYDSTGFYMEFHDEYQDIAGCAINDPLAMALAFEPGLCEYREVFVDVDLTPGPSFGKTFADFHGSLGRPPNMKVALTVQARRFMELFLERVQELARSTAAAGGRISKDSISK